MAEESLWGYFPDEAHPENGWYYFNAATSESSWYPPEGLLPPQIARIRRTGLDRYPSFAEYAIPVLPTTEYAASKPAMRPPKLPEEAEDTWEERVSTKNGSVYFYNRKTKTSSWTLPPGATVAPSANADVAMAVPAKLSPSVEQLRRSAATPVGLSPSVEQLRVSATPSAAVSSPPPAAMIPLAEHMEQMNRQRADLMAIMSEDRRAATDMAEKRVAEIRERLSEAEERSATRVREVSEEKKELLAEVRRVKDEAQAALRQAHEQAQEEAKRRAEAADEMIRSQTSAAESARGRARVAEEELEQASVALREREEQLRGLKDTLKSLQDEHRRAVDALEKSEGANSALRVEVEEARSRCTVLSSQAADHSTAEETAEKLRKELEPQLRLELSESIRAELTSRLRSELRERVERELRVEMEPVVRRELEGNLELRSKMLEQAQADALSRARVEAREEMATAVASAKAQEAEARDAEIATLRSEWEGRMDAVVASSRREAKELAAREHAAAIASMQARLEEADARWRREALLRRKAHNRALELAGNVRVFARLRPVLPAEISKGGEVGALVSVSVRDEETVAIEEDDVSSPVVATAVSSVSRRLRGGTFTFDRVFGPDATQEDVFEEVEPLVVSVLDGFKATVFAYGQTGSGKTHTISGSPTNLGVVPRTLHRLLELAEERSKSERRTLSMELSILEVYNEEIRDLLAGVTAATATDETWRDAPRREDGDSLLFTSPPVADTKLEVRRDTTTGGTFVHGLSRLALRGMGDAEAAFSAANERRMVGAHSMNEHSSRSHLVVSVLLHAPPLGTSLPGLSSKLHIIDLAGSERVSKTDATGTRLKEAQAINKSLSALGNVMEALADQSSKTSAIVAASKGGDADEGSAARRRHIPYRDSKLTSLLEDSLREGSKVLMFVNVSPSRYNAHESSTSLRFAERCRAVQLGKAKKVGLVR
jgi:hypothetical protein